MLEKGQKIIVDIKLTGIRLQPAEDELQSSIPPIRRGTNTLPFPLLIIPRHFSRLVKNDGLEGRNPSRVLRLCFDILPLARVNDGADFMNWIIWLCIVQVPNFTLATQQVQKKSHEYVKPFSSLLGVSKVEWFGPVESYALGLWWRFAPVI